jgi:spermidine synthase
MDNGDVVITLSDDAFLLLQNARVTLRQSNHMEPVAALYADSHLFDSVRQQLLDQQATARLEIKNRRDWISWVGWSSALLPSVRADQGELSNIVALDQKLTLGLNSLGQPMPDAASHVIASDRTEIFDGCYITPDNQIEIYEATGAKTVYSTDELATKQPNLKAVIASVVQKLTRELVADGKQYQHDLAQLASDLRSAQNDLQQYNAIYQQNGYDPGYEVDYGTDTMGVTDAIKRSQQDLQDIQTEAQQTTAESQKAERDLGAMRTLLQRFS